MNRSTIINSLEKLELSSEIKDDLRQLMLTFPEELGERDISTLVTYIENLEDDENVLLNLNEELLEQMNELLYTIDTRVDEFQSKIVNTIQQKLSG